MPLAPGQTLSTYEILGSLGAGAMGEVYRARDTRLEREVAIKVLPEELAADEERLKRFEREAKTLASLNHPNVAGIHGIDEEGDVRFLALELVPGEDLATRLERGPLPLEEAFDVCRQIAEGLEAAHEAGVVHRDLKPANVRITREGVVKIIDFGLAKPIHPPRTEEGTSAPASDRILLTEEGVVLGTPTYMSPEQARGNPVDRRTDVWAFGCVLFECLTGERAFGGATVPDVIAAVLEKAPDLARLPAGTPPRARDLIARCLVKDPRRRLRDVGEARLLLENVASGVAGSRSTPGIRRRRRPALLAGAAAGILAASLWIARDVLRGPIEPAAASADSRATDPADRAGTASVAVLPFTGLGPGDQEYISDGITEEILSRLARVDGMRVASRSSSFYFKGRSLELTEVAAKLGVDHILEGSVQLVGDQLRVKVQLVNASDGFQLWSESYDREFAGVFAIQDEIADSVAHRLELEFGDGAGSTVPRPEIDAETFDLFLQGRYVAGRDLFDQAQSIFERVLDREPEFVPAIAWLSRIYMEKGIFNLAPPSEMFPRALETAERALALDADSAEAHMSAGIVQFWTWDMKSSLAHIRRALEIDESFPEPRLTHAFWLTANGRHDEAIAEARRAAELNAFSPDTYVDLAWQFHLARRYPEAIEATGRALELEPNHAHALRVEGLVRRAQSRNAEAMARFERVQDLDPDDIWNLAFLAEMQEQMGGSDDARDTVRRLEDLAEERWVPPLAFLIASEGIETRLDWLERSFEARDFWLINLHLDPMFDSLRDQPRFQAVVEKVRAAIRR